MEQPGARARARDLFDRAHAEGAFVHDPFATKGGVINPNARCPCGSRKKYKRCCGRARPARVPGDLHVLQARAQAALIAFSESELGQVLTLADADELAIPSESVRWAWLLYWRRYDGFTLADRYLSDPDRGDLWLRRWMETASGSAPDVLQVTDEDQRTVTLLSVADVEDPVHTVQLHKAGSLRLHDLVLGAPVRLMGQTVLLGTWSVPGSQDVAPELVEAFDDMEGGVERLRWPERVIAAMAAVRAS